MEICVMEATLAQEKGVEFNKDDPALSCKVEEQKIPEAPTIKYKFNDELNKASPATPDAGGAAGDAFAETGFFNFSRCVYSFNNKEAAIGENDCLYLKIETEEATTPEASEAPAPKIKK